MSDDHTISAFKDRLLEACRPDSESMLGLEGQIDRFGVDDIFPKPLALSKAARYLSDPYTAPIPSEEDTPMVVAGIAAYVAADPRAFDRALMYIRRLGQGPYLAFRMSWAAYEAARGSQAGLAETAPILIAMLHAQAAQGIESYRQEESALEPTSDEVDKLFGPPSLSPSYSRNR